jgi:hypothetical protein
LDPTPKRAPQGAYRYGGRGVFLRLVYSSLECKEFDSKGIKKRATGIRSLVTNVKRAIRPGKPGAGVPAQLWSRAMCSEDCEEEQWNKS